MVEHVDGVAVEGGIGDVAVAVESVDMEVPAAAAVVAPEDAAEVVGNVVVVAAQIADQLFVLGVAE